uniref:Uncharacterized protein n=1 Tax=Salix viminalis TaxID=40686 RepID=A0A6N2KEX6_SALVM
MRQLAVKAAKADPRRFGFHSWRQAVSNKVPLNYTVSLPSSPLLSLSLSLPPSTFLSLASCFELGFLDIASCLLESTFLFARSSFSAL